MKCGTVAGGAARLPSSARASWWRPSELPTYLLVPPVLLCLALYLVSCVEAGAQDLLTSDVCASYGDVTGTIDVLGTSLGCFEFENVCAGSPESICFPSTLPGFLADEDGYREPTLEVPDGPAQEGDISSTKHQDTVAFKLLNGEIVTCSLMDSTSEGHSASEAENKNVESCTGPPVPDVWMHGSLSELLVAPDEFFDENEPGLLSGSSLPHIEISPPLLDWGTTNLYSPSLAFLKVANSYNESILDVYEPFSSDPQFYAYDFKKLSLSPGDAASIAFIFLPRHLGFSSAHLVLQTNFGGFVVQAKGMADESPYVAQPLVGIDIPLYRKLNRNFSLYNPFDDVVYVEEVTAWVSSYYESATHSSNTACRKDAYNQSPGEFSSFLNVGEWYTVNYGNLGITFVEFRPHGLWQVLPNEAEPVVEMSLWSRTEGKVFGAICMQFSNSRGEKSDRVIIPVEVEVKGGDNRTYNALNSSISAFFEPFMPCDRTRLSFILSLRNSSPYILSVLNISETTKGLKLFEVKHIKGLIAYPETVTKIALVSCVNPFDSQDVSPKIITLQSNCKLLIIMNDSARIEIPCQDLIHACSRHEAGPHTVAYDDSYIGQKFQQEKEKLTYGKSVFVERITGERTPMKSKILEVLEADELILKNWKSQGTMSGVSVLKDSELQFPLVQIGTHFSKWITVHNPSQKPVVMQLLLNSGAIIHQCHLAEDLFKDTFSSRLTHTSTIKTCGGFSIGDSAIMEALVHPLGSASLGPIVFHPSNHCMWRSSVLIRNNLSGIEWLPLRAFGGSHSLILLEGSKPVQELEFRLDLPEAPNLSLADSLYHLKNSASCDHFVSKELYAKNTGKLPLEVLELGISGSDCGLDGFTIHTCRGFTLSPGESARLLVSYQSDFSAAVVRRDLKLTMATGILVVPMKASLPVHTLSLCKKRIFWTVLVKTLVLVLAAVSIAWLVFSMRPHVFSSSSEEYFIKSEKTMSSISRGGRPSRLHHNGSKTRLMKEGEKLETVFLNRNSHCQSGDQGNTQRMHEKQVLDHPKKIVQPPASSTTIASGVLDTCDIVEAPQSGNLTVKVASGRSRRRKRRTAVAGLAPKFEVSGSQSGNSTPSSPLSPSTSTPKHVWPLSPDIAENPFSGASEKGHQGRKQGFEVSAGMHVAEPEISITSFDNTCLPSAQDKPCAPVKSTRKPFVLPPATFPCTSWCAPGLATPFLASASPIALHARAPGSKISKEGTMQREEGNMVEKEFTYDIWGNHFVDHFMCRPKEFSSKVYDASEGDSQSFFSRDPQSLMMMSSTCSVSPVHNMPPYDENCLNEMN